MYLHFSDWTWALMKLDKDIPHGGRIIKVYATHNDPRVTMTNPNLAIVVLSGEPFTKDDIFPYEGRESYTGKELEDEMTKRGLSTQSKPYIRALFRFANLPETQFCQYTMSVKNPDGSFMFRHPFDDIDGLDLAVKLPQQKEHLVHLDIFSERSLSNLRRIVNIDNKESLVDFLREFRILTEGEGNIKREPRVTKESD